MRNSEVFKKGKTFDFFDANKSYNEILKESENRVNDAMLG
jgi:hypothetical protein|tara:strand:+ start:404 stop:523 length:120 start_codon:yes stop_codon:yes gene_type:complete